MNRVALIILNRNGEHYLRRFMHSIIEHTPQGVEIIVADNGSTDLSLALLRDSFQMVRTIELGKNYGYAEGYNRALESINHQYALLLNSDVELCEGWLEPLVLAMDRDPRLAAVAPKIISLEEPSEFEYAGAAGGFIDLLGYPFCRGRILNHCEVDAQQYNSARNCFWASGAAMMCRTKIFKDLGGFSPHFFAHMEEIDLCWRMQLAGFSVRCEPSSKIMHLGGGTLAVDSPFKIELNHRNNIAMIIRCAPLLQLLLILMLRPWLDLLAAFSYLIKGNSKGFAATFRAYAALFMWLPRLLRERSEIRESRIAESRHIFIGSILLELLLGHKRFSDLKI